MKNLFPVLLFVLVFVLSACQQAGVTAMPTIEVTPVSTADELAPYYGTPKPVQAIVNGKTYDSEIGTTRWITEVQPDGNRVTVIGDAFAIITPMQPIVVKPSFSFTLKLPIPINPTDLWYRLFKMSDKELNSQDTKHGAFSWNPDYKTQTYQDLTSLPLLAEQQLSFTLESGIYVFEFHAKWEDKSTHDRLEADYGFLIKAQD